MRKSDGEFPDVALKDNHSADKTTVYIFGSPFKLCFRSSRLGRSKMEFEDPHRRAGRGCVVVSKLPRCVYARASRANERAPPVVAVGVLRPPPVIILGFSGRASLFQRTYIVFFGWLVGCLY